MWLHSLQSFDVGQFFVLYTSPPLGRVHFLLRDFAAAPLYSVVDDEEVVVEARFFAPLGDFFLRRAFSFLALLCLFEA